MQCVYSNLPSVEADTPWTSRMSLRERNAIVAAGLIVLAVTVLAAITCWNGIQGNEDQFLKDIRKRSVDDDLCLWELTAKDVASTLTSPNYPEAYSSNADCQWFITADDPGATVSLKIKDLVIETDIKCRLDYLMVYLGDSIKSPSLGPFCGHIQDKLIETNTSQILLEFHSDMLGEEKGFSIDYFTHKEGGCRKSIKDGSGTLQSPGFPDNYLDDVDCWTVITAGDDKKVKLDFDVMDLEVGDNCTFDYVRVYDGETENSTLLGNMCQETDAKSFESSGSSLLVRFHSDDSVNRKGYKARYSSIDKRNKPVGNCLWQIGAENGTITSPNYPEKYPSFSYCSIWIFAPEDSTVHIDIDTLLLEMDQNCSFDYMMISEGPTTDSTVLGKFCGLGLEPKKIVSSRHDVHVEFQADSFIEFSGFKLRYHFVKEEIVTEEPPKIIIETLLFSAKPGNITIPKGSSSMLPCSTEYPNARIRWLKGDTFLSGETPLPGLRLLPNNSIWIQSMDSHLKGVYTCTVVSPESEEAISAYVAMTDSQPCDVVPEFRKTPSDAAYEENDFAFLECLSSEKQTVLSWEKDGRPLATDDRVILMDNGYISIERVKLSDAGNYTCIATDTVSGCIQKAAAELKVIEKVKIEEICGRSTFLRPSMSQIHHAKIIGGNDAIKGAYPWQVMLWNSQLGPFCGGALINERWVLTAAHCLINNYDLTWKNILVLLGKHKRERGGESEVEARLAGPSSMRIHPSFRKMTFDNDLALIRLDRPVLFTDRVLPVCLGDRNVSETLLTAGTMGTVIGWGRLKENGAYPKYLQEIRLPIIEQARCRNSTNFTVTRNMFCAGYAQEVIGDACSGDSGGPFLVEHEDRWYVVGVVSWGDGCGKRNKYGFYTRIANHLSWIQSIIQT